MTKPAHFCECGDHAWQSLTQGFVTLVDPHFAPLLGMWKWFAVRNRRTVRAVRSVNHRSDGAQRTFSVRLHSLILPAPTGFVTDHINGNGLDNRRSNLRVATYSQNVLNGPARAGTSKYRGVSRHGKRWRALLSIDGKQRQIGIFDSEAEAARAYDAAANAHHGAFARLNFPNAEAVNG